MTEAFSVIEERTKVSMADESVYVYVNDIMGAADFIADGDGKLCILLLDIKDGYTGPGGSYTAGYFFLGDFLEDNDSLGYRSNEADMIYLDTYPAKPGSSESYQTLAHEMQHLMNFATSIMRRITNNTIYLMDTWIDEGLSSAAEYIYLGKHIEERVEWFNRDSEDTIALGNNFFVWGNLETNSILDDYATVYLFFQWLRLQADGTEIYKDIIGATDSDYRAVTEAAKKNIQWFNESDTIAEDSLETSPWERLFESWLAANYINAENGEYGYKNDDMLKDLVVSMASAKNDSLPLLPGEAVYSITDSDGEILNYTEGSGPNIKYLGLKGKATVDEEPTVDDTIPVNYNNTYSGGALLTYNSNTDRMDGMLESFKETGKLTGVLEQTPPEENRLSLSAVGQGKPVRIDARDMLVRNGRLDALKKADLMLKNTAFNMKAGGE
jgi:hypothetical protein